MPFRCSMMTAARKTSDLQVLAKQMKGMPRNSNTSRLEMNSSKSKDSREINKSLNTTLDKHNDKQSMSKDMSHSVMSQNKSNKSEAHNVKPTDLWPYDMVQSNK